MSNNRLGLAKRSIDLSGSGPKGAITSEVIRVIFLDLMMLASYAQGKAVGMPEEKLNAQGHGWVRSSNTKAVCIWANTSPCSSRSQKSR